MRTHVYKKGRGHFNFTNYVYSMYIVHMSMLYLCKSVYNIVRKTNFAHGHKMCSSDQSRERYTSSSQKRFQTLFTKSWAATVSQQSTVHIYIKTVRF